MILAPALFVTLLCARALALAPRALPDLPEALLAFVWQDAAVALAFLGVELALRGRRWLRMPYAALVLYAALNVPVQRVLATPLSRSMWRAARGTLADSIAHHADAANLACLTTVLVVGACAPTLFARLGARGLPWIPLAALALVVGHEQARRVNTRGLERHPLAVLWQTWNPRLPAQRADVSDVRAFTLVPDGPRRGEDLGAFRGRARGASVALVVLESAAATYLRPFGGPDDAMPNLARMAREGWFARDAYCAYPESILGLVAVLASTFPALDTRPEDYRGSEPPFLARTLRDAGYVTGLFHSGRFGYLGMEEVIRDRGYDVLVDAGDVSGVQASSFGVDEEATVDHLLAWVAALPAERPFFATYLPIAGHHPYDAPVRGPFPADDEFGAYRNALHYADLALERLRAGLASRDVLFVVVGDHGQAFGQHEGNYAHSLELYEENVRVPLVIHAPRRLGEPRVLEPLASSIDVAPTIHDLLGLPTDPRWQGTSLLDPVARRALFFTDYSRALLGLREGAWKWILDLDAERSELYDLERDPAERHPLAGHAERVAGWRHLLECWASDQRARILTRRR